MFYSDILVTDFTDYWRLYWGKRKKTAGIIKRRLFALALFHDTLIVDSFYAKKKSIEIKQDFRKMKIQNGRS